MSDNVGSVIFGSGMVENTRGAAEIASLSCPSQKLFLSGLATAILKIGRRPMSGNVGSAITESGMIKIMGFAVSVESLSLTVQFLEPKDARIRFSKKTHIFTSDLGCHIATMPTNSVKIFISEGTVGIPLGMHGNRMHLSQRTWKKSKIIAGGS